MAYAIKELACDPARIKGMSEKLIVSHYENNYGGAVNRLNAITAQLTELDFTKSPGFVINGLKREELIASNSMILHELFFASLGDESAPEGELRDALARVFGSVDRWRAEFSAMGKAQGGGSGWVLLTWAPRKLIGGLRRRPDTPRAKAIAKLVRGFCSTCCDTPATVRSPCLRKLSGVDLWGRLTSKPYVRRKPRYRKQSGFASKILRFAMRANARRTPLRQIDC